jgi:hypothetical protein
MGCTITEINSDEEMENARELFDEAVRQSHTNTIEESQTPSLIPMKRVMNDYPAVDHITELSHSSPFSTTPIQYNVLRPAWDIPFEPHCFTMNQPMWPFNFQTQFTDFPKRIRTVYVERPRLQVLAPRPHVVRFVPSPRVYMPPSPVVYRRIEPTYTTASPYSADELVHSEYTDDEDDLTK